MESISQHRPPNSRTWASGSLNVLRLVYCSGRLGQLTAAAAGAHRAPASGRQAPEREHRARADQRRGHQRGRIPPSQIAAASTSGIPVMNCGASPEPTG